MRRVLLIGPPVLTLGGLVIAVSFLDASVARRPRRGRHRRARPRRRRRAAFTIAGMHRILRDDTYLASAPTASCSSPARARRVSPGTSSARARWDATRAALVLERSGASREPVVVSRPFAGIAGPALAGQIEQARRRASLGLSPR